jgi:RNA polymerase sigma-B factor
MTLTCTDRPRNQAHHPQQRRHPDASQRAERAAGTVDLLTRAGRLTGARRAELIAEVVQLNMGVAEAIASRYRRRGVADDDLRQVAYLALTKAARRFDPEAGHDFLSYAVPTIRGELRRYFRDSGWMVRPPRKVQELQSRLFAAQSELSLVLGRSPSPQEVAGYLEEPLEDVEEALAAEGCFTPTSLDRPVGSDSEVTIGELLGDAVDTRSAAEARVVLAPAVRQLSERDKRVLHLRYFDDYTQQEIAREIGVTQTQVSRLLSRILTQLRDGIDTLDAVPTCR